MKDLEGKIKNENIIYVTTDPERSLGLEKVLPNFYIVCMDNSYILNFQKKYFSLKKDFPEIEIKRSSVKLLLNKNTQKYINSIDKANFMFFKISKEIENVMNGKNILNTSSLLNKKYENKIEISKIFKDIVPQTIFINLEKDSYESIKNKIGDKFVIQFQRGQSGNSTFFIENSDEYNKIKNIYPKRISKASKKIEGIYYTINSVITKNGILIGNLSKQITGINVLTDFKGASVGNEWITNLENKEKDKLIDKMNYIANIMKKDGYIGMFGADFVFDGENFYLIEINARENASIPTFTKLQIEREEIPFKLIHILEFLKKDYKIDYKKINEYIYDDYNFRQIIIRNKKTDEIKIKNPLNGIYNNNLEKIGDGYDLTYLRKNNLLIITSQEKVGYNIEISRIQSKEKIDIDIIKKVISTIY